MTSRLALITFLDGGDSGARPDHTLPGGQGGHPSHPIYMPPYPDQGLPPFPSQGLPPFGPGGQPPYPSQGLPPFPSHPIAPGGGGTQPPLGIWGPGFPYPDQGLPTPPAQPGLPVNLPAQNPGGGWVYAYVPGVGWVWAYKPSDARPDNALPGAQPGIDNTLPTPVPPATTEPPVVNPLG